MKKIKSIILPASLIFLIAAVYWFRLYFLQGKTIYFPELLIIIIYIIWMIFETKVSLAESQPEKIISDFHTREIYALGQALTVLSAVRFSPLDNSPHINYAAGFILFILGILLRIWAIKTLGIYYSHKARTIINHKIVDKGPYRIIRHPAYSGMILAHFGILLCFFNFITLIIFTALFIPSIFMRIRIEERLLSDVPGYREFALKRKKIIPRIW